MTYVNTKIVAAILSAVLLIAGVAYRWDQQEAEKRNAIAKTRAEIAQYGQQPGAFGIGDHVSKTIRKAPR